MFSNDKDKKFQSLVDSVRQMMSGVVETTMPEKRYLREELLTETPGPIKLWKWLQANPPPQWWEFWRSHKEWQDAFDQQFLLWFESMLQWVIEHWDELTPEEQEEFWKMYREYYGRPERTPPMDNPDEPQSPIEHDPPSGLPPYDLEGQENIVW